MRKGGVNNLLQGLAISDVIAPTIACIPHLLYYYGPRTNGEWMKIINIYVIPLATGATFSSNWIGINRYIRWSVMNKMSKLSFFSCNNYYVPFNYRRQASIFTNILFKWKRKTCTVSYYFLQHRFYRTILLFSIKTRSTKYHQTIIGPFRTPDSMVDMYCFVGTIDTNRQSRDKYEKVSTVYSQFWSRGSTIKVKIKNNTNGFNNLFL